MAKFFQPAPLKIPINGEISRHLKEKPPYDNLLQQARSRVLRLFAKLLQGYLRPLQIAAGVHYSVTGYSLPPYGKRRRALHIAFPPIKGGGKFFNDEICYREVYDYTDKVSNHTTNPKNL